MDELRFFKPRATKKFNTYNPQQDKSTHLQIYLEERYKYNRTEYGDFFNELQQTKHKEKNKYLHEFFLSKKWGIFKETLSYSHYQVINLTLQNDLFKILNYIDLYMRYGSWLVMFGYIILTYILATPLYLLFFFLSNYTRQKYMTFWLCVPAFKGVGFAIGVLNLHKIIMNMALASLAVYLGFCSMLIPLNYCSRPEASPYCSTEMFTGNCEIRNYTIFERSQFVYPSLDLLYEVVFNETGQYAMNGYWIVASLVLWLVVMSMCVSKLLMNSMSKFMIFLWISMLICSLWVSIIQGHLHTKLPIFHPGLESMIDSKFWVQLILVTVREVLPGDIISYSAQISTESRPTVEASIMFSMRCLVIVIVSNWISMATSDLAKRYHMNNAHCVMGDGMNSVFASVPEMMSNWSGSKIVIPLYYGVLTIWGTMASFYSLNGLIEALIGIFPKMVHVKYISASIVGLCAILNTPLLTNKFLYIYFYQKTMYFPPLTIFVLIGVYIIVYTPLRITNDYQFAFGVRLTKYWREAMKLYSVAIIVLSVTFSLHAFIGRHRFYVFVYNLLMFIIIFSPIFFCFFTKTISYKTKKTKYFMKPDYAWGPPNKELRDARRRYNPKRELKLSDAVICNHDCVLNSKSLDKEVQIWADREKYFSDWYALYQRTARHKI
ncbi:PREDICTED: uncharacterized protein LOC108565746, partial [Nicrophorus vespilloides]|uniref:Uncharacterized protein LOC108565746 n=1 Tax=Nicrophorus vespilloides TaxID=110193 RepID=A0ABM1N221_NICVS